MLAQLPKQWHMSVGEVCHPVLMPKTLLAVVEATEVHNLTNGPQFPALMSRQRDILGLTTHAW